MMRPTTCARSGARRLRHVRRVVGLLAGSVLWFGTAQSDTLPKLPETRLMTAHGSDCKEVDLKTWKHPTKAVLAKNKVPLARLDLCDHGRFPVFYVNFQYDPMLDTTDSFFLPFYDAMWKANGRNPMGFVVTSSNETIELADSGKPRPKDLHEQFAN